ncbi:MAG: 4'-phosphopantetheinyl transferase superfamily protein [Oscillospiraceae bacterium]|nr:4'-phosphopantetheinyl transferase superfamily protein [Oscillospiraceae bacterium]
MADIYFLDCKKTEPLLLELISRISNERQQKIYKMRKREAQLHCIGAEICLSCALNLPLPLNLKVAENGKPYIEGEREFNISHSGDFVVCAVGGGAVGIDVERISRMREAVFERIASPLEKAAAEKLSGSEKNEYYCSVWTKKESLLKLTGEGIRKELSGVCTESANEHFYTEKLGDYLISLCTSKAESACIHYITEEILRQKFNI